MSKVQSLCVFCGSRPGKDPVWAAAATELGTELARHGIHMVYGGGNVGIMGIVADAVLAGGGEITGVIPESLVNRELAHPGVKDMRVVVSMHTRKALMSELSQGYIALPGGLGTFDELFEILTWAQLGFHRKPVAILNTNGYFDPLVAMLDFAVESDFMRAEHRSLVFIANTVSELLAHFKIGVPDLDDGTTAIRELA
ncbi:TIGR00730 family Rossman fold protein [Planctomicrobium sp. SH527]|uniref:LOG family protein n=1 Tax=Planctomicrobium sp. SH527 TaxID=3448123 RepID=UPI003F5BAAB5